MLVYNFVELFAISFISSFGLSGNLSSSVSVCGVVRDTLLSLSLPMESGDHDWRSN